MQLSGKHILFIVSGGIAAYKALELIRLLKKDGAKVTGILTAGGAQFITPLSIAALTEQPVYEDLFSLKDETEMGHIRLSREADLIVAVPASANFIARLAQGRADDLAATVVLAADKPVMLAPAMNPQMWDNAATTDNIATLQKRGIIVLTPDNGLMACGETGPGRLPDPADLHQAIIAHFAADKPLFGKHALVTSGPTHEPIDPVRYIGNRSSGKQGHAIAQALADLGARVTLVSGPVALPDPAGVSVVRVQTAQDMFDASMAALPADIAVCAAAVADWRPEDAATAKLKKRSDASPPALTLVENPDILASLCRHPNRPGLVIGFAAETAADDRALLALAEAKLARKNCDMLCANAITAEKTVFGADDNRILLLTRDAHGKITHNDWGRLPKDVLAKTLARLVAEKISS